jgi:chromosome segregation ATPase
VAATEFAAQQSQENDLLAQSKFAAEQIQKLLDETLADLEASENREATATLQVDDLRAQIERLTSELATARDAETKLAGATQRELQSSDQVAQLLVQVTQLTDDLNRSRESESQALSQHLAADTAMAELKSAAEKENQILSHQVSSITAERDDLAEQLQQARAENTTHDDAKANELAWLEKECAAAEESRNQLALEFETLLKQHKETEATLAKTLEKQEQYAALLKNAEEKIAELSESTAHEEELEQAQRKFELALADAQKLKRENAELQEELARRPEKSEAESPELVSLRVERDALASRVAELEATPTQIVDPDAERRIEDLQRRFELAVEDVRHLKQENAQLHEKLTKSPQAANHSTSISGAMDWQSQKARLLAALESEDEEVISHERRAERMSIEETISTTDRVIADKEREIVDLRAQLADQSFAALAPVDVANEVIDKDELIAAERAKLEALQKEWHDKLRTAELEMSIQRAALARKESEIEHKLQAALQAAADEPHSPDGKPRRKWLSALGLQADDEKEK